MFYFGYFADCVETGTASFLASTAVRDSHKANYQVGNLLILQLYAFL